MNNSQQEFEAFLQAWEEDQLKLKPYCLKLYETLKQNQQIIFDYKARPNVSYSLRASFTQAKGKFSSRPLFVLLDIIDDEPESRWLSVCFYADMINDQDELGDFVPKGLLGEDALCFNLDEENANLLEYVVKRLNEAINNAK
ncbi:hypothetical protein [Desulfovibrio litoralis]|uniref:DUF5655 domain-containing protein n=1 Tax=Desulfovibrio litoralis DSM 11393 TaxID=1121455 RepID=A0A1M7S951_9BACT|nr:hypothetical protein [Desulfovibrio litoralis]SHN55006.1 hypothetical protein SAMN02745728_00617 [Desulfovibrio litoralis DSM 11393]